MPLPRTKIFLPAMMTLCSVIRVSQDDQCGSLIRYRDIFDFADLNETLGTNHEKLKLPFFQKEKNGFLLLSRDS